FYFFFSSRRRHTRSDRDWSSDVCSSDLLSVPVPSPAVQMIRHGHAAGVQQAGAQGREGGAHRRRDDDGFGVAARLHPEGGERERSEERRVGKECRERWWGGQEKE